MALPFLQNRKLKMNPQVLQIPTTIFPKTLPICRWAFLQKGKIFKIHFRKTPASKNMKTHAFQVPTTIFLMTLSPKNMRILLLQIPATIFLMTSSFMQNSHHFDIHQSLLRLICQERSLPLAFLQKRRVPLAFLQKGQLQPSARHFTSMAQMPRSMHAMRPS